MNYVVDRLNVALEHIDWAIRLLLDEKAYTAAITLAGAAEEILGKAIGEESSLNRLNKAEPTFDKNAAKNLFKHWNTPESTVELELETEVCQYILRAINNLIVFNRSIPSEGQRFVAWLKQNRQDLWLPGFDKILQDYQVS
jgi:hypothetical protein